MKINPEFEKLIPALTAEEFNQLELNCIAEGIREPLIVWNDTLIDGHNRYKIALKNNLIFGILQKDFQSESDVKVWMIKNQFGRRNLNSYQRSVLALELECVFKEKAKEKEFIRKSTFQISEKSEINLFLEEEKEEEWVKKEVPKLEKINTVKEIAKLSNVSHDTIAKVKTIQEKATPEQKEKLEKGEVHINTVFQEIKKEEKSLILEEKKMQNALNLSIEVSENKPEVYHKNCIDFLNDLNDNSVDLLFTDPPYSTDVENINQFAESWVNLALSKVKPNGRAYICIGGYPKEINAYLNILLKQNKFIVDNPLIWTYKNTLGLTPKMKYNLNYQVILHLYSETSKELDTSITTEMWNVMEINAPDGRIGNRYHTWQKPDELAMRLIKHSTKENDLIIDCFACTGTFLLMASKMKRIAKGCDISLDNLKIAEQRGCTIIGK